MSKILLTVFVLGIGAFADTASAWAQCTYAPPAINQNSGLNLLNFALSPSGIAADSCTGFDTIDDVPSPVSTSKGSYTVRQHNAGGGPDNEIDYTPNVGAVGTDNFTILDSIGGLTIAVTITINALAPTVTGVSPTSGSTAGGTSVTITGTNLSGATAVKFGAVSATVVIVQSSTSVSAVSPAGSLGTVDVTVTTTGGISATTAADHFTYVPLPTATQAIASKVLTQNHAATSFTPVTGSGGTAPLSYSISPALPTGLTIAPGTGAITGTPTATSSATTYTVTVTDANSNTAANTFSLAVNSAVTATQAVASKTLTVNHAATSFTPVTGSGGTGTLSYSVSPTLPTGLSMASGTGAITGTPSVTSSSTIYTVTVTDSNGATATATATFSLTVSSAVTATQAVPSTTLTVNHAATTFTPVTGSGGTGTLSYGVSPALPAGLSFSTTTGAITGTPSATSSATTYTVTVTDTNSATATATFSLAVSSAVTAAQSVPSTALTVNHAAIGFTPVTGSGGTGTLVYSVLPTLPAGLSFNTTTAAITGTPTSPSSATIYTVTVTDTNSATASDTFSLAVNSAVTGVQAVAATTLTVNHAAVSFAPVTGSGGTGTLGYSVSPALPAGLSFNTSTGAITGTPSVTSAATTYTVTVTDANNATATATFSLTVSGSVAATQSVASTTLTQNHAATSITPVTGSGGTTPLSYSVSPSLPAGLSIASGTGVVTGTPSVASLATTYTVTVTDANSATATATFSLTVNSAVVAINAIASTTLTVNHAATSFIPVTGSGGTGALTYSVTPTLPAGLSMASGTGAITGTPSVNSSATTYTVTVTDANNATATATFSLTVNSVVVATQFIATTTLVPNQAATSFTPVAGSGGTSPLSYGVSPSLPTGLTFNTSTGAIAGTPTVTSTAATYTVTVTDANSATAIATFSLTIAAAPTVSSIIPAAGPSSGATVITITGAAFTASSTVTFGSIAASSVTFVNATTLTAVSPAGTGTVDVTVTATGGTSATSAADQFTYSGLPTVTAIAPPLGLASGGITVTITGTAFAASSTVKFGSASATDVVYLSPTTLTAISPAGSGTVDVTVTTTGGTSVTSAADQFSYLAQVSSLVNPLGVALDGTGNLYIADSGLSYIVKVPAGCSTLTCETIAGAGLTQASGVSVDGNGSVYVLSGSSSGIVTKLPWNAVTGNYGAQTTVATGLNLTVASPSGIAADGAGNLYFADTQNQRIFKLPWNANAGTFGPQTVLLSGSTLSAPTGVAVDTAGNLYIADAGVQKLFELAPSGTLTVLATSISATSVAVDGSGDVYYSDSSANTITKLPWSGTAFGSAVVMATGLSVPYGVAVDDQGNLFSVNSTAHTIVKATVTTLPSLSFAPTKVDAMSTDSPRAATLANIGNAPLSFPPTSGINPTLTMGFTLDNSSTCPEVSSASSAQTLAQGTSCKYAVDFTPTSTNIGSNSGTLTATDTDLNNATATQTISLSGTGIAGDASSVTLTLNPVSPVVFGKTVAITAVVADTTTPATTATGNVAFTSTNSASATTTINSAVALSGGTAIVSAFTPTSAGAYTITGNYSGAVGSIAPGTGSKTLIVNQFTPVLVYTPVIATQTYGSAITASALNATAVDVNGNAVAGTFAYTTTIKSALTTLVAGNTVLPAGTYTITATFTPTDTADYVSGGTITASYSVTNATATVTLGSLSQTYIATALTATAVTNPAGLNVSFTYNGGSAAPVTAGSYTVVATVNDPNYTGTATGTLIIAKATPAAILLSSSVNPVLVQNVVLLTATISSPLSTPTGTVNFLDGTTSLGIGTLSNGTATLFTSALTGGTHNIMAVYQGDTNFLALSSSTLTQTVLDFTLNISTASGSVNSVTVAPGGTATYLLTISPTGATTLPAAVALSASGLPVGATSTFSPSSIASGAGATNVTLTVVAPQTSASMHRNNDFGRKLAPFSLALLLLPFTGRLRKSRERLARSLLMLLLIFAGISTMAGLSGCGSSSTDDVGQAQKSYTITVTGTSGSLSHSIPVTLTIQ